MCNPDTVRFIGPYLPALDQQLIYLGHRVRVNMACKWVEGPRAHRTARTAVRRQHSGRRQIHVEMSKYELGNAEAALRKGICLCVTRSIADN